MPRKKPVGWERDFYKRASDLHSEARRFLTAMAVGSLGVLYATLTGKAAPPLIASDRLIAIIAILAMAISAAFGLASWRADAAWAYRAGKNPPTENNQPDGGVWHQVKKVCDLVQLVLFGVGLLLSASLALRLIQ